MRYCILLLTALALVPAMQEAGDFSVASAQELSGLISGDTIVRRGAAGARKYDVVKWLTIQDKDLVTPPASPTDGHQWIVPAGATGAWAGLTNRIARWTAGAWEFSVPVNGWTVKVIDEGQRYEFNGTAWILLSGGGGGGGDALTSSPLSQFAPTTSAQLAAVITDETGTGANVHAVSPVLTTPNIGAATGSVSGNSGNTNALQSATTTVNTSSAAAPTTGQVLTATSGTAATWQTPSGGGAVSSVFGRTGAVVAASGDYTPAQVGAQASDAELLAIAGLTSAADRSILFTGSGTASLFTLTTAGLALLDDADAAAQRATLGLGTLATQSGTFSGTSSGTNTGDQVTADAGGDATTFPMLATAATGLLNPATDPGLTYDATANSLALAGALTLGTDLAITEGGTGASSAAAAVDALGGAASTGTGGLVRTTSPTIVTPTIASLTNAQHSHQSAAGGGTLDAAAIAAGTVATARLGSGTASSTTFLRGDQSWQTIGGGGDALTSSPLSQFAATTSAQLRGVLSDETGTGADVFAGSPTFTGVPVLADPTATTLTLNQSGLHLLDTNASHDLIVNPGSDLTADRTLTITTGDASRTLTLNADSTLSGTNTGDQTITLTGDVTGSGTSSFAATIATASVTLAKQADLATDRLIGRDTAGTGVPESLTVSGGLEFSGSGGIQRSALTGDVTASAASGATTIADESVGWTELADGTAGQVPTWSAAGEATTVATGTAGHVLTSNGTGAAPTFQAAAGGSTALPLDNIDQTILGAWSVSGRLRTAYTGALIRVRDVDDDAETDIGCVGATAGTCDAGSRVDTTAIQTHCNDGTGVCRIATAYDQSGNARNLTQATEANMPLFYTANSLVVCGVASTPCFRNEQSTAFGDGTGTWLARTDSLGLTGNPGVSMWYNYRHDDDTNDRFVWSLGESGGACYTSMTSQTGGSRMTSSTTASTRDFANTAAQTFGYYNHVWAASGTVQASTVARNAIALGCEGGCTNTGSATVTNVKFIWGASPHFSTTLTADGWLSTLIAMAAPDADDTIDLQTWFGARN